MSIRKVGIDRWENDLLEVPLLFTPLSVPLAFLAWDKTFDRDLCRVSHDVTSMPDVGPRSS